MPIIAFDCDGTLEDYEGNTRHEIVDLLRWYLANTNWTVLIWSGGGEGRATSVRRRLGLEGNSRVIARSKVGTKMTPEVAIDDQYVALGKVNVYVGPKEDFDEVPGGVFGEREAAVRG